MDSINSRVTAPSIGQLEYLRYLQRMRTIQAPSFMKVELELPEADLPAVEKTIRFFINRHESLRTIFPFTDGRIAQVVLPPTDQRFRVEYITVARHEDFPAARNMHFEAAAALFADIEEGPLVKVLMFNVGGAYVFSLLIHHIICDEWSMEIIRTELAAIYEAYLSGKEPLLPPLGLQLADYCTRQNVWLHSKREMLGAFWKEKLENICLFDINGFRRGYARRRGVPFVEAAPDLSGALALGAILDRPDAMAYTCVLEGTRFQQLRRRAVAEKRTLSALVYAAFFVLLYTYTGKKRPLIPVLVADRFSPGYEQIVGCLLGSVYLSMEIKADLPVKKLIGNIHRDILLTMEQLIFSHEYLDLDGVWIRNCCDMYINYSRKKAALPAGDYAIGKHIDVNAIHYPIYNMIVEYNDALVFIWKYNKYLFTDEMIADIAACYETILAGIAAGTCREVGAPGTLADVPGSI